MYGIDKHGRFWKVFNDEKLICITVYKKGALEVKRIVEEDK